MNTTTTHRISEGTASAKRIHKSVTTDPFLLDTTPRKHPPLRYFKRADAGPACGFGTCSLSPECTSQCRYREADQALRGHYAGRHTQRQAMPEVTPTSKRTPEDLRARALAWKGVSTVAVLTACALGFALWQALN